MKRIALITGGGRGIGLAIARQLAAESFNIVIADVHEQTAVADALRSLEALGAEVLYCRADVTDATARQTMLADIRGRFGALHVLVNNAGVAPAVRADITEMSEASYERVMRINLQGPFFLTQAVANWLLEQQAADPAFSGCVINISSISAEVISISRGEYCLSKAGVSMATQLWPARLGPAGLPVYEVRPG
ncbi:MAG: SDR family NAD(P)-dependent oxidoreductase, partial [Candidatus Marinimicrobia bacterium]|nr:SDR family NAD(P)-dependent oxidoreductase [Candidatus Neomarinimicrobiota bacterium]